MKVCQQQIHGAKPVARGDKDIRCVFKCLYLAILIRRGFQKPQHSGAGGEIQLTDAIEYTIGKLPVSACRFEGHHADTGNPGGMLEAALHQAGKSSEMRQMVKNAIADWD